VYYLHVLQMIVNVLLDHFKGSGCRHQFVIRPVVMSLKLSMIDPQLQWNTNSKLAPLILLPHLEASQMPPWRDYGFCCTMLCIGAAYAIMRCLSVCRIRGFCQSK